MFTFSPSISVKFSKIRLLSLLQPKKMDTATGSGLMEEFELMKQAKYRVYMQNIDKALKNFEYSSEWADLISALGKLNKVRRSLYGKGLFTDDVISLGGAE
jgi:NAD-dependent SIR2 family protein deacetylase